MEFTTCTSLAKPSLTLIVWLLFHFHQVNGQTHQRGANLHEFADLLIRHGVVNAINLDGGGSSTFVNDQVLINYPSDHW